MKSINNNRKKFIEIFLMFVVGFIFYFFMGKEWISMQDDSIAYINAVYHEGVMPIYPIFLFLIRLMCGESIYLDVVVCIQSLLALVCTMVFVLYLQKQFELNVWESLLLYVLCMLPFSIYLPEVGITHQILTEGIAYALFYLYFLFLLKYIFSKSNIYLLSMVLMAGFLQLTRSQLIFLHIVNIVALVYVQIKKDNNHSFLQKANKVILSFLAGCCVMLLMVVGVYKVYGYYLTKQVPVMYQIINGNLAEGSDVIGTTVEETDVTGTTIEETDSSEKKQEIQETQVQEQRTMSQMTTLLMIRGFYEADPEDIELFHTPEEKEIFVRVFEAIDKEEYRYVYARQDLYIWKDLIKDKIAYLAYQEINQYLAENPEIQLDPIDMIIKLGMRTLIRHFDRFLYHTARLMISSFIASVFFQIQRVYLLCHFITLGLFLAAILGIVLVKRKDKESQETVFVEVTVGYIVIMVVVTNIVYIGLQRYVVYAMGIFYCSLYLLVKSIWKMWKSSRYRVN